MKKKVPASLALCAALLVGVSACGKPSAPASSASSAPSGKAASAASSSNSKISQPASSASGASSSASSSGASARVDTSGWMVQFISTTVDGTDQKVLVVLRTPPEWKSDGHSTFTKDDIKIAEVTAVYPSADGSPFPAAAADRYAHSDFSYPSGFGLQRTDDRTLNGRDARIYLYKTWPDDSDKAWYPHYALIALDGYAVDVHFYSFAESADDAVFDTVLGSAELHFRDTASSSSGSAPTAASAAH